MFEYFDKLTEEAANKSFDDIYAFYNEEYYPMEYFIRSMIRQYISRNLMDTSEDKPLECEITVETDNACGLSSLQMPHISAMYQEDDIIWCEVDDVWADFEDFSVYEQMSILEGFNNL
ncbi:MAG: hypothetical protein II661_09655 [Bacteroidales bacterium]|nr:hypothetical protein [Bacteroidales bacterium]